MLSRLFGLCPAACIDPFHATSYSSTRLFFHGFSSNRDKNMPYLCVFSALFFLEKGKKKKKTMQQRCIEYRMLELLFVLPILSFFQRFDKNFITRSETKRWKNEICQFFLPLFFPPFSINFNSSFQKHLPYVIASNVWNYRMFADARANWNTELRKWNYR